MLVRAVTTDAIDSQIVGKDEDDVGFLRFVPRATKTANAASNAKAKVMANLMVVIFLVVAARVVSCP